MSSPAALAMTKFAEHDGWWPFRDGRHAAKVSTVWLFGLVVVLVGHALFGAGLPTAGLVVFPGVVWGWASWGRPGVAQWAARAALTPWRAGVTVAGWPGWGKHLGHRVVGAVNIVTAVVYVLAVQASPVTVTGVWVVVLAGLAVARTVAAPTTGKAVPVAELADWRVHLAALRACGYKPLTDDDGTPTFMPGVAAHHQVLDDGSSTTWYALPDGWSVRRCNRDDYASRFNVERSRVVLQEHHGRAGQLAVTITAPPLVLRARPAAFPTVADWRTPVVLGQNEKTGTDVVAPTWDTGLWMLSGIPGSGKTRTTRLLVAKYAADPTTTVWLANGGKGADDWGPVGHRCADYFDITAGEEMGARTSALLETVLTEIRARYRTGLRQEDHRGALLLLEESTELRASLEGNKAKDAFDVTLGRICRIGRAANVTVVLVAQKPSGNAIPTDIRSLAKGKVCHRARDDSDAAMALGKIPEGYDVTSLAPGHALVDVGDGIVPVWVDRVDTAPWETFCAALPSAVAPVVPTPQDARQGTPTAPTAAAGPTVAPTATPAPAEPAQPTGPAPAPVTGPPAVYWAAVALVRAHPDRVMTPTALHYALPDDVRPPSVRAMSLVLAGQGWRAKLTRFAGVKDRFFRAVDLEATGGTERPAEVTPT